MKIEYLKNFIKLAEYKSFSELARDLSMSQSTLSHQISQLEKELGNIILIDRTTRKFNITRAGEILLNYAKKIVKLSDDCEEELLKFKKGKIEVIKISASTFPGSYILPRFITDFKNQYQNVNFNISINNSEQSIKLLSKGLVDFAGIGSFMGYNKNDFDYVVIGEDKFVFVCSPNHELLEDKNYKIELENILKYPFITREKGSGTRNIFEQQFDKFNQLNVILEINDNDSIISAVSGSNYISILSELIAKNAEEAGLIKIIKIQGYPSIAKREIYLIKLKEKEFIGLKKEFWENFLYSIISL
ncbi:MAG: LysR substrate-binding domain-containing protein [Promethearchaeota archaeon]